MQSQRPLPLNKLKREYNRKVPEKHLLILNKASAVTNNCMRTLYFLPLLFLSFSLFACSGCKKENNEPANLQINESMKLKITVGTITFTATLYDNATAKAFKTKLPMTINMRELNDNEKYFDLPDNLPANASNPGKIQSGDLMLYGKNTLVLFYKSFSTSYDYTRLGKIDDPSELATALGSGNITVAFEAE